LLAIKVLKAKIRLFKISYFDQNCPISDTVELLRNEINLYQLLFNFLELLPSTESYFLNLN